MRQLPAWLPYCPATGLRAVSLFRALRMLNVLGAQHVMIGLADCMGARKCKAGGAVGDWHPPPVQLAPLTLAHTHAAPEQRTFVLSGRLTYLIHLAIACGSKLPVKPPSAGGPQGRATNAGS